MSVFDPAGDRPSLELNEARMRAESSARQKRAVLDVVGCGAVTRRFHLPALQWLEWRGLAEVRYCLDPDLQAASFVASRFRRARPASALSSSQFDVAGASTALVATPPEHHSEWAQQYLEVGAHVLVEKPAVLTTEQFSLLKHAASARQCAVLVGHVRRLFPSVSVARAAVVSGKIGRLRSIEAHEGARWSWTTQSDFPIASRAGGVLYDLGSHTLDMALFVCGLDGFAWDKVAVEVLRVQRWPDREPSHELRAKLVLRTGAVEVPFAVQFSRRASLANVVRVRGDRGELLLGVSYGRTCLYKTDGASLKLKAECRSAQMATAQACFLAEHLELWRTWALAEYDSPLALPHFGLLTRILEMLARGP